MIMRLALSVFGLIVASTAVAKAWQKDCWGEVTKRASLRKYHWEYNWGCSDYSSDAKEGLLAVTGKNTTEGSTWISDPGITTGEAMSYTQGLSSWGPCSIAMEL